MSMTIETATGGGQEALWVEQAHLQARQSLLSTWSSSLRGRHQTTTKTTTAVSPSVVLLQQNPTSTHTSKDGTDASQQQQQPDDDQQPPQPPPDHLFVRVLASRKLLAEGRTTAAFEQALAVRQAMESTPVLLDDVRRSTPVPLHDTTTAAASSALIHVLHDAVAKGHAAMEQGQYERAQELLDFILPPATTVVQQQHDNHPAAMLLHSDGVSSLGFEEDETTTTTTTMTTGIRFPPFPLRSQCRKPPTERTAADGGARRRDAIGNGATKNHDTAAADNNGEETMEAMSMSSLNEILDGPLSPSPQQQRGRFSLLRFSKKAVPSALDSEHHGRSTVAISLQGPDTDDEEEEEEAEPCRFMATIVVGEEQQSAACWDASVEVSVAGLASIEEREDTDDDDHDHGTVEEDEEEILQMAPACVTVEEEVEHETEQRGGVSAEKEEDAVPSDETRAWASVSEHCSLPSATASSVSNGSSRENSVTKTHEVVKESGTKRDAPAAKRLSPLRRMFSRRRRKKHPEQQHDHEQDLNLDDLSVGELLVSVEEDATNLCNQVPVSPSSVSSDRGDRYTIAQVNNKQEQLHFSKTHDDGKDDKYSILADVQQKSCLSPLYGCDSFMLRGISPSTAVATLRDEDDDDGSGMHRPISLTNTMSYNSTVQDTDKYGDAGTGINDDDIDRSTKELKDEDQPVLQPGSTKRFALFRHQLSGKEPSEVTTKNNATPWSPPPQTRAPLRGILKSSSTTVSLNEIHSVDQPQHDKSLMAQQQTSPPLADDRATRLTQRHQSDENTHYNDPLLDRLRRRGLEPREPQAPRLDP